MSGFLADAPLARAGHLLAERLGELEVRIRQGEDVWTDYLATVTALVAVLEHTAPGRRGELLSTKDMAELLGITPKTLLRRKKNGRVKPTLAAGKFIRWKGTEALR